MTSQGVYNQLLLSTYLSHVFLIGPHVLILLPSHTHTQTETDRVRAPAGLDDCNPPPLKAGLITLQLRTDISAYVLAQIFRQRSRFFPFLLWWGGESHDKVVCCTVLHLLCCAEYPSIRHLSFRGHQQMSQECPSVVIPGGCGVCVQFLVCL